MDMYECSLRIRVAYVALNRRVKSPLGYVNSCWQAGPAELEAEDLDEALADARVLRNWGEAAVEQVDKYQSC